MRPKLLIFTALVIVAMGAYWLQNQPQKGPSETVLIEFRADGFHPKEISINKGDTVVFKTTRGDYFWPASNLHPTHSIYPEFDPRKPIGADDTWNFRFNEAGIWNYHDHLASIYTGVITVVDKNHVLGAICENQDETGKLQCWESKIDSVLKENDIETGFDLIEKWYATEPFFRTNCHAFIHKFGASAYGLYAQHKTIELTPKASYCGYGFYHGFIEALLATTGSFDEAREFCLSAGEKLINETKKPVIACFHGIGHGAVDGSDPRAWGNEDAIMAPALELCEKIGGDDRQRNLCATGAYNGLSIAFGENSYGLKNNDNDPYAACKKDLKSYFEDACYEEMNTNAMRMAKNDFSKAIRFAEAIGDDRLAVIAVQNLSPIAATHDLETKEYDESIAICQKTQERLRAPCIAGMIGGVLESGRPGAEYLDGIEFCSNKTLTQDFAGQCFVNLIANSNVLYPKAVVIGICHKIDEKYRNYCPK